MSARLSEEVICAVLAEKNWEPVEGWEYVNAATPIPGRCLICGYEGPGPRYNGLKKGSGPCLRCSGKEKISNETVRALLKEKDWEPTEPFEYVDNKTKIPGRCLVCAYEGPGPTYTNLKRWGACLRCGGRESLSEEMVRALLAENNWEPDEPFEYVNSKTRMPGRCAICGQRGLGPKYNNLDQGRGACKECGIRKSAEKRRLPEETVRALLAEKDWEPIPGWEYISNGTQIPGRCLVEGCGYESGPDNGPTYDNLQSGAQIYACVRCSGLERISEIEARALLAEKLWEPIPGWNFVNVETKIPGRCLATGCGYESEPHEGPTFHRLSNAGACRRCGGNERASDESVRTLLEEKNWEPIEGWEYVNRKTPIPGRCLVEGCGYEGPGPTYTNLKRWGACPSCAEHGYDPLSPGAFYRFEFIDQGQTFLCYGITNDLDTRRKHYERKLEIKNFQSLHFDKGSIPQELEKQFHEIRKESSVPASTCGVVGTITESFSLSPENWELFTVFEAHWAAAALRIPDLQEIA